MNKYPNRRWLFLNSADKSSIDFTQVLQSDADSMRSSLDGSKTFVKYHITEFPEDLSADNVDSAGNTYEFEYEQIGTEKDPDGNDIPLYSENIVGSGIAFVSGHIEGRPSVYDSAITISGKKEFAHSETLSILAGSDWTTPIE
jgi:hypothetical protein